MTTRTTNQSFAPGGSNMPAKQSRRKLCDDPPIPTLTDLFFRKSSTRNNRHASSHCDPFVATGCACRPRGFRRGIHLNEVLAELSRLHDLTGRHYLAPNAFHGGAIYPDTATAIHCAGSQKNRDNSNRLSLRCRGRVVQRDWETTGQPPLAHSRLSLPLSLAFAQYGTPAEPRRT